MDALPEAAYPVAPRDAARRGRLGRTLKERHGSLGPPKRRLTFPPADLARTNSTIASCGNGVETLRLGSSGKGGKTQMTDILVAVVTFVGTALVAVFGTYVGTREKIRSELARDYDVDLRRLRLEHYPGLWRLTEPLALYRQGMTHAFPVRSDLNVLIAGLRAWYFRTGGLFLSEETRDAYFLLQDGLEILISSPEWGRDADASLDPVTFHQIRRVSSWLRTRLTVDMGTRSAFSQEKAVSGEAEARQSLQAIKTRWGAATPQRAGPD